jgi:hypothetical protein
MDNPFQECECDQKAVLWQAGVGTIMREIHDHEIELGALVELAKMHGLYQSPICALQFLMVDLSQMTVEGQAGSRAGLHILRVSGQIKYGAREPIHGKPVPFPCKPTCRLPNRSERKAPTEDNSPRRPAKTVSMTAGSPIEGFSESNGESTIGAAKR